MILKKDSKIFIAGHKGMVGRALVCAFQAAGYSQLITIDKSTLNLLNQNAVNEFFEKEKPIAVINAAARVGGILANNDYPFQFLMENMLIQNNLLNASLEHKVEKFIFLGSSCIYPKFAPQPLKEEYLLTGALEPTNEWYALAKITGVKACEAIKKQFGLDYYSLMPTNLYGNFDNFDLTSSHVLPAMIRKFHDAKINNTDVTLWGSGSPMREFLYVDDLANAVLFLSEKEINDSLINVGVGNDVSIADLANLVKKIVGHKGQIIWDKSKPDGTPKKLMDVSKLNNLGWKASTSLEDGIEKTYNWFLTNKFKEVKIA